MCEAEMLPNEAPAGTPDDLCRNVLASLVERIGAERFPSPLQLDDPAWVGYRLAEALPLSMDARQQLLEIDQAADRLDLLHGMLVAAGIGQTG